MMEAQVPMFLLIAIAVGAGLLAVFVLWVSKFIANEKTRSQGLAIAAITVGVLVLGLFVTRASHRPLVGIPAAPVPPSVAVASGETTPHHSSVAPPADSAGRIEAHTQHHQPPVERRVAAKLAWGPLTIAAVVVAIVVLLTTSRKGLAASLAGLGIAGVVLSMIFYAALDRQMVRETGEMRMQNRTVETPFAVTGQGDPPAAAVPAASAPAVPDPKGHDSPSPNSPAPYAAAYGSAEHDAAPADASAPTAAEKASSSTAEATLTSTNDTAKSPPPAWIDDEPTVTDGVYRAVVVSGPYSTKRECELHLDEPLRRAMMEYGESQMRPSAHYASWADIGYIHSQMIEDRFLAEEQYENPLGKMYKLHVRLKVEPRDVARFEELARYQQQRRAVETASAGGIFVFGALVVLYGALRFVGRKRPTNAGDSALAAPAEATA